MRYYVKLRTIEQFWQFLFSGMPFLSGANENQHNINYADYKLYDNDSLDVTFVIIVSIESGHSL